MFFYKTSITFQMLKIQHTQIPYLDIMTMKTRKMIGGNIYDKKSYTDR